MLMKLTPRRKKEKQFYFFAKNAQPRKWGEGNKTQINSTLFRTNSINRSLKTTKVKLSISF